MSEKQILSEEELDRALAAVHADVRTEEATLAEGRATLMANAIEAPPARSIRRWLVAAAAVLVLVASGLVVQGVQLGDKKSTGNYAAAAGLNAAAARITAADPPVRHGQYLYIGTRAWWGATIQIGNKNRHITALEEHLLENWVPADRSEEWLHRRGATGRYKWIVGSDAEAKEAGVTVGRPYRDEKRARCGDFFVNPDERPCAVQGGWQNPKPDWIAGLPRDPRQLYDRLRADAPKNSRGDTELLVYAADALRSGLLPADLRSALYRALALIPDLEVTERQANLDGRVGVAYGMDDGEERHDIIIDERTGQFIGERQVATKDGKKSEGGVPAGTVTAYTSVTTAVVDRMGARP